MQRFSPKTSWRTFLRQRLAEDQSGTGGCCEDGCAPERVAGDRPARDRHVGDRLVADRSAGDPEQGTAVVEFVFLAVLLMIPVVYLVITVGQLQGGAYAVTGAADQAAKVYVAAPDPASARAAAEEAVLLAMADYGFDDAGARLDIGCDPAGCLSPGALVTATVTLAVPLPLVSSLPGGGPTAATVDASASQIVGRFK